jgi:hypothetical protein
VIETDSKRTVSWILIPFLRTPLTQGLDCVGIILRADGNIEHPPDPLSKRAVIDEFGLQARDFRSVRLFLSPLSSPTEI